jgi:23S rRNA (adenine2030-N6)-methyltransferase
LTNGYNHQIHAGNAGDVWKHFILVEVAENLFFRDRSLVYAESHVGRPKYALCAPGEWEKGIGRLWRHLPSLQDFLYFRILADLNPQGLRLYPGSASLVLETARRRGTSAQVEVWDINPEVAACWRACPQVMFHCADGFSGVHSFLSRPDPGLLLIDPPYSDAKDLVLAKDLFFKAQKAGWVVLWWQMPGPDTGYEDCVKLELEFNSARMDGGKWKKAAIFLAGADRPFEVSIRVQAERLLAALQDGL